MISPHNLGVEKSHNTKKNSGNKRKLSKTPLQFYELQENQIYYHSNTEFQKIDETHSMVLDTDGNLYQKQQIVECWSFKQCYLLEQK